MTATTESILCPLCEYDLRGLPEARCPECGGQFSWDELTDPSRRKHLFLFEHHPERNFWSFRRTLFAGMFPIRFWRSLHPVQAIRPRRLAIYWLVCSLPMLLVVGIYVVRSGFAVESKHLQRQKQYSSWISQETVRLGEAKEKLARHDLAPGDREALDELRQFLANDISSMQRYIAPLSTYELLSQTIVEARGRNDFLIGYTHEIGNILQADLSLCAMPLILLATMLVFRTSMRRAGVRIGHLLRVAVYSADIIFLLGLIASVEMLDALGESAPLGWNTIGGFAIAKAVDARWYSWLLSASIATSVVLTIRMAIAIAIYLQFKHALPMAISLAVIIALIAIKVVYVIHGL
jgi:hypothetical protein